MGRKRGIKTFEEATDMRSIPLTANWEGPLVEAPSLQDETQEARHHSPLQKHPKHTSFRTAHKANAKSEFSPLALLCWLWAFGPPLFSCR